MLLDAKNDRGTAIIEPINVPNNAIHIVSNNKAGTPPLSSVNNILVFGWNIPSTTFLAISTPFSFYTIKLN